MCGLFGGLSTNLVSGEIEFIRTLGILSQFRGYHSTGLGFVADGKKNNLISSHIKEAMDSSGFLYAKAVCDVLSSLKRPKVILGHCRQATHGDVNKENAHPYHIQHIIGAHNGTINKLAPTKEENCTDSFKLYKYMAENDLEKTLEHVEFGAYALTWIDNRTKTFNMIRNGQRPLWLVKTKGGGTTYWASERRMLEFAMKGVSTSFEEPFELPVDTLYSWSIPSMKETIRKIEVKRSVPFVSSTFERRAPPSQISVHDLFSKEDLEEEVKEAIAKEDNLTATYGVPFDVDSVRMHIFADDKVTDIFSSKPHTGYPRMIRNKDTGKVKHLRYKAFKDAYITADAATILLNKGCMLTGVVAKPTDKVVWLEDNHYIMYENAKDEFIQQYYTDFRFTGELVYVSLDKMREAKKEENKCL